MAALAALLAGLVTGCLDPVELALPSTQQAQVLLLLRGLGAEAVDGQVLVADADRWVDAAGQPARLAMQGDDLVILGYAGSAQALQLAPGPLPLRAPDEPGRELPPAEIVLSGEAEGGAVRWQPRAPLGASERAQLRVAPFDFGACAELGGCVVDPGVGQCTAPCPDTPVPTPPDPPRLAQVPGWVPLEVDGARVIGPDGDPVLGPPEPRALRCPAGQMRRPDETACRAVAVCPPPDAWPADPPANAVYVRSGAAGDGRATAPFGTLAEAFAVPDRPVVFEGRFDLLASRGGTPERASARRLVGVCPERATLFVPGAPTVNDLTLDLRTLRLELDTELRVETRNVQHSLHQVEVTGGALTFERSDVRIEDSRVHNPDEVGMVFSYGGDIQITGSYFLGQYAVHAFANPSITVRDSAFEGNGREGHGLSCSQCGPIDYERFIMLDYGASGIGASRTAFLRIVDGQILDMGSRGITLQACRGDNEDCIEPGPEGFATTASIARVRVRSFNTTLRVDDGRLQVSQTILQPQTTGLSMETRGGVRSHLEAHQIVILGTKRNGMDLIAAPGAAHTVRIEDALIVRGVGQVGGLRSLVRSLFQDIEMRRAHLEGSTLDSLLVSCGPGLLEDVHVQGSEEGGIRLIPSAPFTVRRARVRDTKKDAVRIYPADPGAVFGSDACATFITDPTPAITVESLTLEAGTIAPRGLTICTGGPTTMQDVRIEGYDVGMMAQEGLQSMTRGHLVDNVVGVQAGPAEDLLQVLRQVRIDGSSLDVVQSDEFSRCQ